jgi:hypothetical protein
MTDAPAPDDPGRRRCRTPRPRCPRCCCTSTWTAACAWPRCSSCCSPGHRAAGADVAGPGSLVRRPAPMPAAWSKYLEGLRAHGGGHGHPTALERVAFEAAEDARADGAVLAEFRIAPLLFEPHGVAGEPRWRRCWPAWRDPLPSGLIVCAMRQLPEGGDPACRRTGAALAGPRRGRLRPGRRRTRLSRHGARRALARCARPACR